MIRIGDIVIVAIGVALTAALSVTVYSSANADIVRVTQGRHEHRDFSLAQQQRVSISGPLGETVLEIDAGRVRVIASPCSRKICLRAGWLSSAGDATACVPNRVSIALLGSNPRFDAMNF